MGPSEEFPIRQAPLFLQFAQVGTDWEKVKTKTPGNWTKQNSQWDMDQGLQ
jgi:hypothetical protein